MSKLTNLQNYLLSGATATPLQIKKMFKLSNPTAAIHELRSRGYCIYANQSKLTNGTETVKYKIGAPTKSMIKTLHSLGMFS